MKLSICTWHLENRFGYEKAFQMIKDAGFDALDYNLDDWIGTEEGLLASRNLRMSEEELVDYYTRMYETAQRIGLEFGQTHAVFGAPAALNHRELYMKLTVRDIIATSLLHCHHTVVHPVALPDRLFDEGYDACHEFNLQLFRELIPYLKKYNVKIAIEPMWYRHDGRICPTVCSRPEEILAFIDELGSDCFCACPDLGHFALTGPDTGDTPAGALRKLGKAVEIIHAHEVEPNEDRHTKPYTYGTMDWADIIAALREIGYTGNLNFEVGGTYFDKYPDALVPEALRHLAEIGKGMLA
ncbi:MAG: sugar phosphate isomerase/epimerase [Clostridia bacterium]|nr:sugar phosphate isomerase/epimerase [Clostridia bacterium]